MRSFIRLLLFGMAGLFIGNLHAQAPYVVYVYGYFTSCTSGQAVTIQTTPGTLPEQTITTTVGTDCLFFAEFAFNSPTGGILAYTDCGNGTLATDSGNYTLGASPDTTYIALELMCTGDTILTCQACFTVTQSAPFTADFTSCSFGGTPPYTNVWLLQDGTNSLDQQPTFTFDGASANYVCLQSTDATGCTNVYCETVLVGADGTINPTSPLPCLAGFYTAQAYSDTLNGGIPQDPIPYEVWVVDLSEAIDGIDTYLWNFGDGTTSTQMYPTHQYAGPGPYQLCLTISNSNCSDSFCEYLSMDDDGLLNGMTTDPGPSTTTPNSQRSGGLTLKVLPSSPVSVSELPNFADFKLWPNPTLDELNISLHSVRLGMLPITVIATDGRVVLRGAFNAGFGRSTFRLNVQDLAPALYLIQIGEGTCSMTNRFLKL